MAEETGRRRYPFGNYGLGIVLGLLFLLSWAGQFIAQLIETGDEARQHGQSFSRSEFWPKFFQATFENWQSEFLQLLTFVVLTTFLIHRGSAESRDTDDEIQAALARIEERLDQLQSPPTSTG